ncbi:hypothetical protein KJ359_003882 [Pestalotiopsis sp. 9143b]|nr:hypothetical protein KJ359_003882 [Pestalotiopsis sp. 9143b]
MGGGPIIPTSSFTLRVATKKDLDDITRIHIEGFTEEPQVHYCFPLREKFPEEHWKWTRKEYENYLEQPDKYVVYVLESPVESDGTVVREPTRFLPTEKIQTKNDVSRSALQQESDSKHISQNGVNGKSTCRLS